ncbi:hypothetical protein [Flagellimonas pacifica]|uniref:N-acetylglutamate synthase n=1 Tax=Flagellimonas pacifica TaxID=1247520 RepID=A0A285MQC8_9FLAO|nr:hypothetical protein [Allomuricauda parva]SNY99392.1 hypothetical protein SAMN06265377_1197 [Allomuricauda parva]
MTKISLNKVKMNVIKTSNNGVVNKETIFIFTQNDNLIHAEYTGGQIVKGFLVGNLKGNTLKFSYCQLQVDGRLDNGSSTGEISTSNKGKIRLTEYFKWDSRPGQSGTNIFEQI